MRIILILAVFAAYSARAEFNYFALGKVSFNCVAYKTSRTKTAQKVLFQPELVQTNSLQKFVDSICSQVARPYSSYSEIENTVTVLWKYRMALTSASAQEKTRNEVFAVSVLMDELLYQGKRLFPNSDRFWSWKQPQSKTDCELRFHNTPVCHGDFILSQSYFMRAELLKHFAKTPSTFPHLAIAWKSNDKSTPLWLFEGVMNGVGFIPAPNSNDRDNYPLNWVLYRWKKDSERTAFAKGLEQFIHRKTKSQTPALRQAVYGFDFTFKKPCAAQEYFCSKVPHCIAKETSNTPQPLPEKLWSENWAKQNQIPFSVWNMPSHIPYSSDLEFNSALEPLSAEIDTEALKHKRRMFALSQAILAAFQRDAKLNSDYQKAIAPYQAIQLDQIDWNEAKKKSSFAAFLPKEAFDSLLKLAKNDANLGQTIFFFMLESEIAQEVQNRAFKNEKNLDDLTQETTEYLVPKIKKAIQLLN